MLLLLVLLAASMLLTGLLLAPLAARALAALRRILTDWLMRVD